MTTRWSLRFWVTLSALAVILLFATVAADAMLQGTQPPSRLSTVAATPPRALTRATPLRKAIRAQTCPNTQPAFTTI